MFRTFVSLCFIVPLFGCDVITYTGTMQVKGVTVPAKATYEEIETLKDPIIKITYEISGKAYHTTYMSNFGDKVICKPRSIIVYNDGPDKKQNYYFKGKERCLILF